MDFEIVVDIGYGDSGKGRVVDLLAGNRPDPLVVRYTGGHQAGHTVVRDGVHHVFASFGSGTLAGAPSYFSEHTLVYLPDLLREAERLAQHRVKPRLYVHPMARLVTPYDVAYNRAREEGVRHGSCGAGIGATMRRCDTTHYRLHAADLAVPELALAKLDAVGKWYETPGGGTGSLSVYEVFGKYLREIPDEDFDVFGELKPPFRIAAFDEVLQLEAPDTVIMEGAQGIMLDMDHGVFPNVTYGRTTSRNAWEVIGDLNASVKMHYVTRPYQARHGEGWMADEPRFEPGKPDPTNTAHPWQGTPRYRELDYDLLTWAVNVDRLYHDKANRVTTFQEDIVFTCMDHMPKGWKPELGKLPCHSVYASWGPASDNKISLISGPTIRAKKSA